MCYILKRIGFKDIKYDIQTASHVKPVVENVRKTVPDMKLCVTCQPEGWKEDMLLWLNWKEC